MKTKLTVRVLAILLAMLFLAACTSTQPPESTATLQPTTQPTTLPTDQVTATAEAIALPVKPLFATMDEYPRMDGSTACLPLMAQTLSATMNIALSSAEDLVSCTTTSYAYDALLNNFADILLVYEPAEETWATINESPVELEFTPIGRDALVFIGNQSNAVNNLTEQQLMAIYKGATTNWKDVGGSDLAIAPFQRASASGSQALFMKLFMKNETPMQAPTEFYPSGMGDLIEAVAEYNNTGAAIGFSVFYYASYMYSKPGLKFFNVNGIAPTDETIASGQYPYTNDFYVVTRKDDPADSPAKILQNWIVSQAGKQAMLDSGYISVLK